MSYWPWILLGVYLVGAVLGWWVVIISAFDTDWTFSQMGAALIWPLTLIWLFVFSGGNPRNLPKWIRRHWG